MALGSTGVVVVAALAAGVAGAGAAVVLMGSPAAAPAPPAAVDGRVAALEQRLAKQEGEIRALQARLEEAAAARISYSSKGNRLPAGDPAGPAGDPLAHDPADAAHAGTWPEAAAGGEEGAVPRAGDVPVEPSRFSTLYRAEREKEQGDARKARLAAEEARIRARLDRAQDPGLSQDQKDAIVRILMDRSERSRQAYDEARSSGTPEAYAAAREKASAVRTETRQALEVLLTPEQLKIVDPAARMDGRRLGGAPGEGGRRVRQGGGDAGGGTPR